MKNNINKNIKNRRFLKKNNLFISSNLNKKLLYQGNVQIFLPNRRKAFQSSGGGTVSYDNSIENEYIGNENPHSFALNVAGNYLLVACSTAFGSLTGISYNGDAMTLLDSDGNIGGSADYRCYLYGLANPDIGNYNISAALAGPPAYWAFGAVSFLTAGSLSTISKTEASTNTPNTTVVSSANEIVLGFLTIRAPTAAITPISGGGQIERANTYVSDYEIWLIVTTQNGTASTVPSWTFGEAKETVVMGVAIKP